MKPFVFEHILAPTDLSESSLPALRSARRLADGFSARLTVLYVEPITYPVDYLGPAAAYIPPAPDQEAQLRNEVERYAAPELAGRAYETVITVGQPVMSILSVAHDRKADLIVMGTHLRHGWRRALLGSVSEVVLHGATCAVMTVAKDDASSLDRPVRNILCPINFTEVARASLDVAARMAAAFDAQLSIVHVLEHEELTNHFGDEERVKNWVAPGLRERCSYRQIVLRGGPAERVLDCAEDLHADFLVIGAQHKFFRDATVIGTTTERLIRFASCPVLVVPKGAEPRRKGLVDATIAETALA
jgi:nucleotide-binding universal stress UspA family protein